MIQLRIPIGTAASAQMPRILPREYCFPVSDTAFARLAISILFLLYHPNTGCLWDQILRVLCRRFLNSFAAFLDNMYFLGPLVAISGGSEVKETPVAMR
jgi:hypothetical protein